MDLTIARKDFVTLPPLLLVAAGLTLLYYATAKPVMLIVDGEAQELRTHARQVSEILSESAVELGPNDHLRPGLQTALSWEGGALPVIELTRARNVVVEDNGNLEVVETAITDAANLIGHQLLPGDRLVVNGVPGVPSMPAHIEFQRSIPVRLIVEGSDVLLHSSAPTLGGALLENDIQLFEGDRLSPPPNTPLAEVREANLDRSVPITIRTAESQITSRSAAPTVGEALAEAGLPLTGLDYSVPDANSMLPEDGEIRIVRVSEEIAMEQEPLGFETLYQPMGELEIDSQQVIQPGAFGVTTNRIRVRREDGEEVDRTVEGDWIAQEPTPQIIGYGTQIRVRSVSTPDGNLDYWRAVPMYATSYSPSRAGVSPDAPWFGITASGKRLVKGLVAIDRSLIPFGTMMYVPGYGFAEAADTGSGVKGRWIDLGYEDDNWVSWSGYVTVYFLTPVPPADSIVYIFP